MQPCDLLKSCDQNIKATFQLVEQMITLANQGDVDREDAGCGVLYGVLRDAAYRVKKLAEQEKRSHIRKGWWKEDTHSH